MKHFGNFARRGAFLLMLMSSLSAFLLSGCSDDEDFADALAWYRNDESGALGQITLAFYDDNTFVLHQKQELSQKSSDGKKIVNNYDIATGTYSGNPTSAGTVTVTYKKVAESDSMELGQSKNARFLGFGDKTETYGNDKFPLGALPEVIEKSYTITSENKISYEEIEGIPLKLPIGMTKLELTKGRSGTE